mmetsp:Transcript_2360/g.9037  ORF Transcript_2360/g.9037 Transcript_2360/m.9037 type:complete len:790 (-) Transcript_2360:1938-4307(-)
MTSLGRVAGGAAGRRSAGELVARRVAGGAAGTTTTRGVPCAVGTTLPHRQLSSSSSSTSYGEDASRIGHGDVATLHELLARAGSIFGERNSLGTRCPQTGAWRWTTFAQRAREANACSRYLRDVLGVRRGDRVAVVSKNRTEWATAAYGTYGAGAAFVPMYEQQPPSDWEYIVRDSEASVLFVSRADLVPGALRAAAASPAMKGVVCFDPAGVDAGATAAFAECLKEAADQDGKATDADTKDAATSQKNLPSAHDLATLIYTSGTTGKPKGVELTHENLVWNALTIKGLSVANLDALPAADRPGAVRSLSILPWAHIFGQTCELHAMTALGSEVALATDATTFLDDVQSSKPTVLIAVPALYNRIFDNFEKTKAHMPPWKRKLADRAVALGDRRARSLDRTPDGAPAARPLTVVERVELALLDRLVLRKIRDALGGRVKAVGSGGAALDVEVRTFLEACGLRVANGYGLTETAPVLTYERAGDAANRAEGSIGRPLPGVDLKVAVDAGDDADAAADAAATGAAEAGELVVSSPGVMRGYWRNPDATAEVLSTDATTGQRWFRTGDQGVVDAAGSADATPHVRIVGRIKEQYKLANGKYVVPTVIEEHFARSRFVSQVFLYGDNQPSNVALVVPDWTQLEDELCNLKHTDDCPDLKVAQPFPFNFAPKDDILGLVDAHWDHICDVVARELKAHSVCKNYEYPKKIAILTQGFNVARGMLTPKLSLRRNVVYQAHKDDIDALYAADAPDVSLVRVPDVGLASSPPSSPRPAPVVRATTQDEPSAEKPTMKM